MGALRAVLDVSLGNLALNLHGGFAGEGSIPVKELEEQDPQAPKVEGEGVRLVLQHFGRHVFQCPTEGTSGLIGFDTPPEVTDLQAKVLFSS